MDAFSKTLSRINILICNQGVGSSSLSGGTIYFIDKFAIFLLYKVGF